VRQPKALGISWWIVFSLALLLQVALAVCLLYIHSVFDEMYRAFGAGRAPATGPYLYVLSLLALWLLLAAVWGRGQDLRSRALPDEDQRARAFSAIRWRCWGSLALAVFLSFASQAYYAHELGATLDQRIMAKMPPPPPAPAPAVPASGTADPQAP
jgi:hypothetical protein